MHDNNCTRSYLKVYKALICCIFLFILHPFIISAEECMVPEAMYAEVSRHVLGRCYLEAELVLDQFICEYPDEPAGALLKAAVPALIISWDGEEQEEIECYTQEETRFDYDSKWDKKSLKILTDGRNKR